MILLLSVGSSMDCLESSIAVVTCRTFLELRDESNVCWTRPRAKSDPTTSCLRDEDTADTDSTCTEFECISDTSSNCGLWSEMEDYSSPMCRWGCEDLELDLAGEEDTASLVRTPSTTCSTPATPPGVFKVPTKSLLAHATTCSSPSTPPGMFMPNQALLGGVSRPQTPLTETRTTLMLRNLPSTFTRTALCQTLDAAGFEKKYDFAYLPVDFQSGAGLGYAFVNMVMCEDARNAVDTMTGFCAWSDAACHKVLKIDFGEQHQGLKMLIERYKNCGIMHPSVPDEYKPMMLAHGQRIAFPQPSKRVRSPM